MDRILVLLRHGQSDWNLKNLFTGWKDPDLTSKGVEEARAAGICLKERGLTFDRAFTSSLVRAQHTLELVLAELGTPGLETVKDRAINERDYGVLCGLNKDDAIRKWGADQVTQWRRSYDVRPPGGESLKDTVARVIPYYCQKILPADSERPKDYRRRPRQFAARADHGPRPADAGNNPEDGTRNRHSGPLPPQTGFDCRQQGDACSRAPPGDSSGGRGKRISPS